MAATDDVKSSFSSSNLRIDDAALGRSDADEERATLAKTETKIVTQMEYVLFFVLLIASLVVSLAVYSYSRDSQQVAFRNSFNADAEKLLEAFHKTIDSQLEGVDALSVQITSHAEATASSFPFVSLPNFGVRFGSSRVGTGSFMVGYYPLVTDETRTKWEEYAVDNRRRFYEALALEVKLRTRQDEEFNYTTATGLHSGREPSDQIMRLESDGFLKLAPPGSGPYLPIWHLSPVTPDKALLNFDTLSHPSFAGAHLEAIKTGQAVIDVMTTAEAENTRGTGIFYSTLMALSQYRQDHEAYHGDPTSTFAYPVFDSFDIDTRKVVGVVGTSIQWKLIFKHVLPKDTRGIYCVLENSRNQTYTYRIDEDVSFVGEGDHHDQSFNDFEQVIDIAETEKHHSGAENLEAKSFTSVELDTAYCNYKLRIYPSTETEAQHVNRDPIRAMLVVMGVFLFTSITFVVYACAVSRRQRIVMDRAIASGAIVSSLFPSQVREQIYQESDADKGKKARLSAVERDGDTGSTASPIASAFEAATVMFADIVGFTKWTSSRTPVQVFELLETIYQAFDAMAVRRKVFKVETIGDCYVAAAGLPNPQEHHAVIMAKFADACIVKMGILTRNLAESLGPDTTNLTMRIGLHSGSVTGGVLRGHKSRYQLFGDTMNTASRMESNGIPGRIHISQATANELQAKGKSHWVVARSDKITAKGKGEMQTYWVNVQASPTGLLGSSSAHSESSRTGSDNSRS